MVFVLRQPTGHGHFMGIGGCLSTTRSSAIVTFSGSTSASPRMIVMSNMLITWKHQHTHKEHIHDSPSHLIRNAVIQRARPMELLPTCCWWSFRSSIDRDNFAQKPGPSIGSTGRCIRCCHRDRTTPAKRSSITIVHHQPPSFRFVSYANRP